MRAFILLLAAFLLAESEFARASGAPELPSRKASVVKPLLNQIAPKDSPKNVMEEIEKILGQPDLGDGGGPSDNHWHANYYWLADKAKIIVATRKGKISILVPGQPWKDLYAPPKS